LLEIDVIHFKISIAQDKHLI